jgi:cold-inducible RNA-binding protein
MGPDSSRELEVAGQRRESVEKKLFVGNLPYNMTDAELEQTFSEYGTVESAVVIRDRDTGRSRGFGFVEMASGDEAEAAQRALDGSSISGRPLRVNEAHPREARPNRSSSSYDERW